MIKSGSEISRERREIQARLKWRVVVVFGVILVVVVLAFLAADRWGLGGDHWVEVGVFEVRHVAQIETVLNKRGFIRNQNYKISDDARMIYLEPRNRNVILLALAEEGLLPDPERGFGIMADIDASTTDLERQVMLTEALKSEMRRMIRSYRGVIDVTISVPVIESPIDDEPLTATIVLTLDYLQPLTDGQIRSIYQLLARAFENLEVENITMTDQNMTVISYPADTSH